MTWLKHQCHFLLLDITSRYAFEYVWQTCESSWSWTTTPKHPKILSADLFVFQAWCLPTTAEATGGWLGLSGLDLSRRDSLDPWIVTPHLWNCSSMMDIIDIIIYYHLSSSIIIYHCIYYHLSSSTIICHLSSIIYHLSSIIYHLSSIQ